MSDSPKDDLPKIPDAFAKAGFKFNTGPNAKPVRSNRPIIPTAPTLPVSSKIPEPLPAIRAPRRKLKVEKKPKDLCPVCQCERRTRTVNVIDATCWRNECGMPMKIAFGSEGGGGALAPEDFTEEEIAAARAAGAKLEVRFSKTTDNSYLANVCPHCDVISGSFFLHDYWYEATDENRVVCRVSCARCEGRS